MCKDNCISFEGSSGLLCRIYSNYVQLCVRTCWSFCYPRCMLSFVLWSQAMLSKNAVKQIQQVTLYHCNANPLVPPIFFAHLLVAIPSTHLAQTFWWHFFLHFQKSFGSYKKWKDTGNGSSVGYSYSWNVHNYLTHISRKCCFRQAGAHPATKTTPIMWHKSSHSSCQSIQPCNDM